MKITEMTTTDGKTMQYLQAKQKLNGDKTTTMYDHLADIVDLIVAERPRDALGVVEVLSRFVKEAMVEDKTGQSVVDEEGLQAKAKYGTDVLTMDIDYLEKDGEGVVTGPKQCCAMPDYMIEADTLAWAGAGFSMVESYKVMCSVRNLATRENEGIKQMRFWGKILGTDADYYVVEAERDGQPDMEPEKEGDEPPDPKAVMYNLYAYYVATDTCGSWVKLPDLRPRELLAARAIRKLFTGKLDAKVITHPYFDGTEANLLRAQIALITANTVLGIKGMYLQGEEEPLHLNRPTADSINPDFEYPAASDMLKPGSWVHAQPHILNSGLTMNEEPAEEAPEKDDVEAYVKYLKAVATQEADLKRELQRSVATDGLQWTIKQAGDAMLYASPLPGTAEKPKKPRATCVSYARSLTWPGAVAVHRGEQVTNLYVGYGWPAGKPDFFFPAPLDIQDEPDDRDEVPEPVDPPPVDPAAAEE